jgi:transposase InsO family protein
MSGRKHKAQSSENAKQGAHDESLNSSEVMSGVADAGLGIQGDVKSALTSLVASQLASFRTSLLSDVKELLVFHSAGIQTQSATGLMPPSSVTSSSTVASMVASSSSGATGLGSSSSVHSAASGSSFLSTTSTSGPSGAPRTRVWKPPMRLKADASNWRVWRLSFDDYLQLESIPLNSGNPYHIAAVRSSLLSSVEPGLLPAVLDNPWGWLNDMATSLVPTGALAKDRAQHALYEVRAPAFVTGVVKFVQDIDDVLNIYPLDTDMLRVRLLRGLRAVREFGPHIVRWEEDPSLSYSALRANVFRVVSSLGAAETQHAQAPRPSGSDASNPGTGQQRQPCRRCGRRHPGWHCPCKHCGGKHPSFRCPSRNRDGRGGGGSGGNGNAGAGAAGGRENKDAKSGDGKSASEEKKGSKEDKQRHGDKKHGERKDQQEREQKVAAATGYHNYFTAALPAATSGQCVGFTGYAADLSVVCEGTSSSAPSAAVRQHAAVVKPVEFLWDCASTLHTMTKVSSAPTGPPLRLLTSNGENQAYPVGSVKIGGSVVHDVHVGPHSSPLPNCLSVGKYTGRTGHSVILTPTHSIVVSELPVLPPDTIVRTDPVVGGLYVCPIGGETSQAVPQSEPPRQAAQVSESAPFVHSDLLKQSDAVLTEFLHKRFSHASRTRLRALFPALRTRILKIDCATCQIATCREQPFRRRLDRAKRPLFRLHYDTCFVKQGSKLSPVSVLTDEFSSFHWTAPHADKAAIPDHLCKSISAIRSRFDKNPVAELHSDRGTEVTNAKVQKFCDSAGIDATHGAPGSPQQNGVSERAHSTIFDVVRKLIRSHPKCLRRWRDALSHATMLLNALRRRDSSGNLLPSPYELLHGTPSPILSDPPFGSEVLVRLPGNPKLADRGVHAIYLGRENDTATSPHKVLVDDVVMIVPHIQGGTISAGGFTFDMRGEAVVRIAAAAAAVASPPQRGVAAGSVSSSASAAAAAALLSGDWSDADLLDLDADAVFQDPSDSSTSTSFIPASTAPLSSPASSALDGGVGAESKLCADLQASASQSSVTDAKSEDKKGDSSARRSQRGNKGAIPSRYGTMYAHAQHVEERIESGQFIPADVIVPKSVTEAMRFPWWRAAIEEHLTSLEANETWEKVSSSSLPPKAKAIPARFIFKVKREPSSGLPYRCKARLVCQGFRQKAGRDFDQSELYAPTARLSSVLAVLAISGSQGRRLHKLDCKDAFLKPSLEGRDLYVAPPTGLPSSEGIILKLRKPLFGLRQAPSVWHKHLIPVLRAAGFSPSKIDVCVWIRDKCGYRSFLVLHVDDILLSTDPRDNPALSSLRSSLNEHNLEHTLVSDPKDYLGMVLKYLEDGLHVSVPSSSPVIAEALSKAEAAGASSKALNVPYIFDHLTHFNPERDKEANPTLFRSLVCSVAWVADRCRPDVVFAIRELQKQQVRPSLQHLHAAYAVLRYVRGTPSHGILFRYGAGLNPVAYSDANFARDSLGAARSTSGGVVLVAGAPVVCFSHRQSYTATSTEEAEFGALWETMTETIRIRNLLRELVPTHVSVLPLDIYCDNQAVVKSISSPYPFQTKLRNINTKERWAAEQVQKGDVLVRYIPSKEQRADILTKCLLNKAQFLRARAALGVVSASA